MSRSRRFAKPIMPPGGGADDVARALRIFWNRTGRFCLKFRQGTKGSSMQRKRVKQTSLLGERLEQMAEHCRQKAANLPPGDERDGLMRKARQAETASRLTEWVSSPGLRPPE